MKKAVILLGSVKHNKGSEAIGRGLAEILHKANPDIKIVLSSNVTSEDNLTIPYIDKYSERICTYSDKKVTDIAIRLSYKLNRNSLYASKMIYKNIADECENADLIFFIGGDNFDENYGAFTILNNINNVIESVRKPESFKILFDCSFNPNEFNTNILKIINSFDIVTARESVTFTLLKNSNVNKPIYYFPDPAFGMSPQETELPKGVISGKTIGVNVSPTVMGAEYGSNEEIVMSAYKNMIAVILNETDCNVLLVPHVFNNQDLSVLRKLYNSINCLERIFLFENEKMNAAQMKYIISKCALFVGARTHSTIAAYSSCVPTIVLGYSVKSRGISKDLFGREDAYVIQVGNLKDKTFLASVFRELYKNREQVRSRLQSFMPSYIANSYKAGEWAGTLLREEGHK